MLTPILWVIAGMAAVTYIPRVLPFFIMNPDQIPSWLQGVLKNVPYAILGALILPGILTVNENMLFGAIGGIAAFAAAYFGFNLIFVVITAIGVLSVYSYFGA